MNTEDKLVALEKKIDKLKPKEKKEKLSKYLSKKLSSKPIIKKEPRATLTLSTAPVQSTWEDPNRFFKGELDKEKRSLFFS